MVRCLWSCLGTGDSPDRPTKSTARPNDQSTTGQPPDQSGLVEVLCEQVGFLHQQLEEEREANRENQRLIRRASAAGARARVCTGAARRGRDGLGEAGQGIVIARAVEALSGTSSFSC
jgi:hypothetical protein